MDQKPDSPLSATPCPQRPLYARPRVIIAAIMLSAFLAGFLPLSPPALKHTAEKIVAGLVDSCSIGNVTVTLWSGISLNHVSCSWHDAANQSFSCAIPRIAVSYHLLPLLFQNCIVKEIRIEKPDIYCILPSNPPGTRAPAAALFSADSLSKQLAAIPFTVIIRSISLSEAHITVLQKKQALAEVTGLDCSMKIKLKRTLNIEGKCTIADIALVNQWHLTKLKCDFHLAGLTAVIDRCGADCYGGRVTLDGSLDLAKNSLESLRLSAKGLHLDQCYAAAKAGPGTVTGTLTAAMTFHKSQLFTDSLKAKGHLKISDLSASNLPIQKTLFVGLFIPKMASLKFSRISSDLVLGRGRLHTENFNGFGDVLDFKAHGSIGLNGYVNEKVTVIFSRDFTRTLPDLVRTSLLPVPPDRRSFSCTVRGFMQNPLVAVDQRIINRTAANALNSDGVKKTFGKIGKSIGKLFK
ncbi:MAG: AsmA-like C-terminal region-containing protein [Chitinispirillaceae bacterium]|nr:AsmA-like C-terminal region-containing protein [Chitinispirillaceae bacterium]